MRWASEWRLYYIAAALFLIAAVLSFANDGLEWKPVLGLVMAAVLLTLGLKSRKQSSTGELPDR